MSLMIMTMCHATAMTKYKFSKTTLTGGFQEDNCNRSSVYTGLVDDLVFLTS